MRDAVRKLTERLPLEFRVLYRHFLLQRNRLGIVCRSKPTFHGFWGSLRACLILIGVIPGVGISDSVGPTTFDARWPAEHGHAQRGEFSCGPRC